MTNRNKKNLHHVLDYGFTLFTVRAQTGQNHKRNHLWPKGMDNRWQDKKSMEGLG